MNNIHTMQLSGCEFCETQCSKRHTLLTSINEILPIFYTLTKLVKKFSTRNIHKNVMNVSFGKISAVKAILYLQA
jgi:hypothetical protein